MKLSLLASRTGGKSVCSGSTDLGAQPCSRQDLAAKSQRDFIYLAMRSCVRFVPIAWKVETIWAGGREHKNLLASVAQFRSSVNVGSPLHHGRSL
jgi:hypothetical protein